eukprot:13466871-Heterocapsa_arctica.AAC.1
MAFEPLMSSSSRPTWRISFEEFSTALRALKNFLSTLARWLLKTKLNSPPSSPLPWKLGGLTICFIMSRSLRLIVSLRCDPSP